MYKIRTLLAATPILLAGTLSGCGGSGEPAENVVPTPKFTVTSLAGQGGKVAPGSTEVASGQSTSFTLSPDEGYEIAGVSGCNGTLNGNQYTTGSVASPCTVTAEFKAKTYQITLSIANQPAEKFEVKHDGFINMDIRINEPSLTLDKTEGCAGTLSPVGESGRYYQFLIQPVRQSCELKVSTRLRQIVFNISAGEGGTVYPASQTVFYGEKVVFQIEPEPRAVPVNYSPECGKIEGNQFVISKAESSCNARVVFVLGDDPVGSTVLNDTGADKCFGNDCLSLLDLQDGAHGRDAQAKKGELVKTGQGDAGFDFTKLDQQGLPLASDSTSWSCVRDNHTGLIWEVKTTTPGLQHQTNTYSWYSSNTRVAGEDPGVKNAGACQGSSCDSEGYSTAVNALKLCGRNDWRLPTLMELLGIVNNAKQKPAIDGQFFPETLPVAYWTQSYARGSKMRTVNFNDGSSGPADKSSANAIRLVSQGN